MCAAGSIKLPLNARHSNNILLLKSRLLRWDNMPSSEMFSRKLYDKSKHWIKLYLGAYGSRLVKPLERCSKIFEYFYDLNKMFILKLQLTIPLRSRYKSTSSLVSGWYPIYRKFVFSTKESPVSEHKIISRASANFKYL